MPVRTPDMNGSDADNIQPYNANRYGKGIRNRKAVYVFPGTFSHNGRMNNTNYHRSCGFREQNNRPSCNFGRQSLCIRHIDAFCADKRTLCNADSFVSHIRSQQLTCAFYADIAIRHSAYREKIHICNQTVRYAVPFEDHISSRNGHKWNNLQVCTHEFRAFDNTVYCRKDREFYHILNIDVPEDEDCNKQICNDYT